MTGDQRYVKSVIGRRVNVIRHSGLSVFINIIGSKFYLMESEEICLKVAPTYVRAGNVFYMVTDLPYKGLTCMIFYRARSNNCSVGELSKRHIIKGER